MLSIINRYIFKEMAVPFFLGIAILTATSLLSKIPHLIQLMVNQGVSFFVIVKFLIFIIPSFLVYIIPVSFLIAVLIAYNRFSSDNEITAMKASGLSILSVSKAVALMAFLAYAASTFLTVYAFPWGNISSRKLIYDVVKSRATIGLKEWVFNDTFDGLILYADRIVPKSGELKGIFISDERDAKGKYIIVAQTGIIASDPEGMKVILRLFNGTMHMAEEQNLYKTITFGTYDLSLSFSEEKVRQFDVLRNNRDLTLGQLQEKIVDARKKGDNPAQYLIDLHKRFALPVSIFVFGLLAVPLGIQRVRTTKFTSFTIGLMVVIFYYVLSTAFESFGKKGLMNPVLAVWGANIMMGIIGMYMFFRAMKDSPIKSLVWLEEKKERFLVMVLPLFFRRKK